MNYTYEIVMFSELTSYKLPFLNKLSKSLSYSRILSFVDRYKYNLEESSETDVT